MKNRKKISEARRRRADYPVLVLWEAVILDRPECGRNVPWRGPGKRAQVLNGEFVFSRLGWPGSPSRYAPHVGKKQLARKARTA